MFVKMSDGILKEEKIDLQEFRHFYKMQKFPQIHCAIQSKVDGRRRENVYSTSTMKER